MKVMFIDRLLIYDMNESFLKDYFVLGEVF